MVGLAVGQATVPAGVIAETVERWGLRNQVVPADRICQVEPAGGKWDPGAVTVGWVLDAQDWLQWGGLLLMALLDASWPLTEDAEGPGELLLVDHPGIGGWSRPVLAISEDGGRTWADARQYRIRPELWPPSQQRTK